MKYEVPPSLVLFINKQLTWTQHEILQRIIEGQKLSRPGTLTEGTTNNFKTLDGGSIPANVINRLHTLGLVDLNTNGRGVTVTSTELGAEVYLLGV